MLSHLKALGDYIVDKIQRHDFASKVKSRLESRYVDIFPFASPIAADSATSSKRLVQAAPTATKLPSDSLPSDDLPHDWPEQYTTWRQRERISRGLNSVISKLRTSPLLPIFFSFSKGLNSMLLRSKGHKTNKRYRLGKQNSVTSGDGAGEKKGRPRSRRAAKRKALGTLPQLGTIGCESRERGAYIVITWGKRRISLK